MPASRLIGVTVLPEYIQSEGVEPLLDNLTRRASVTAVATSPYVMELADESTGSREPPIDAGAGKVRLLDRPLWGRRELWVRTSPSFRPEPRLYEGLRYQPAAVDELTSEQGGVVAQFIQAARGRGLKVYFQVMAAIPPGYRVQFGGPVEEDQPRLPNGEIPARRVANNGCLASPHLLAYQKAFIRDLHRAYPDIDGIRFDWPEYPPYLIDSAFLDFSPQVESVAEQWGFNFSRMKEDASRFYATLHGGLTDDNLEPFLADDGGRLALMRWAVDYPGVVDMLRLKSLLSERLLIELRQTMTEVGGESWEMAPSAFPPPWSWVSGMDVRRNAPRCDAISVKLYGMHWAMMLRFYGDQLLTHNPGLNSSRLCRALVRLLDFEDGPGLADLHDYRYPEPDEPHPGGRAASLRKIAQAQAAAGDTPIHVLAHGYGPLGDFRRRIEIARDASPHGFWVNRYAYLSDDKLDAIGEAASSEEC